MGTGLQQLTKTYNTGLVGLITPAAGPLQRLDQPVNHRYDFYVQHLRITECDTGRRTREHLARTTNPRETQFVQGYTGTSAHERLTDLLLDAMLTQEVLAENGRWYADGEFAMVTDTPFYYDEEDWDEDMELELDAFIPDDDELYDADWDDALRFRYEALGPLRGLAGDGLKPMIDEARWVGWTLYKLDEPYASPDPLGQVRDFYVDTLFEHDIFLDERSAQDVLDSQRGREFLRVDNQKYLFDDVYQWLSHMRKEYVADNLTRRDLVAEIGRTYMESFLSAEQVSLAAEKVFECKFSDLADQLRSVWFSEAQGEHERVVGVVQDVEEHLYARLRTVPRNGP